METFVRDYPGAIIRENGAAEGMVAGIIATEGEASDGHIIDIAGMELPSRPPMLFGHDSYSGERNLGSWETLSKEGSSPGKRRLRGDGPIELGGPDGPQKAWREDMAFMVGQGHIRGLSVRWAAVDKPVRRVNLSKDHWAAVDGEDLEFGDPRNYGLYFGTSRMEEASVVTFGADPKALIGRAQETAGDLREFWRGVAYDTLEHDFTETDGGILVRNRDGQEVRIPAWVYEKLTGLANERLRTAFDLVSAEFRVERELEEPPAAEAVLEDPQTPEGDPTVQERDSGEVLSMVERRFNDLGRNLETRVDGMLRRFEGRLPEDEASA